MWKIGNTTVRSCQGMSGEFAATFYRLIGIDTSKNPHEPLCARRAAGLGTTVDLPLEVEGARPVASQHAALIYF